MGWIFPIIFAGIAFFGLWKSGRMSRQAMELALAALLIGVCGYAWQGSPDVAGFPVAPGSGRVQ